MAAPAEVEGPRLGLGFRAWREHDVLRPDGLAPLAGAARRPGNTRAVPLRAHQAVACAGGVGGPGLGFGSGWRRRAGRDRAVRRASAPSLGITLCGAKGKKQKDKPVCVCGGEVKRREEELRSRMAEDKSGTKRPREADADDEEQRKRKELAVASARAEEERRRLAEEARKRRGEEERRVAQEAEKQRREEERRLAEEHARQRREQEDEERRRRLERRKKEEEDLQRRREAEAAQRRVEEDQRRREEAERMKERQRRLNEEARRRKEHICQLGMLEAAAIAPPSNRRHAHSSGWHGGVRFGWPSGLWDADRLASRGRVALARHVVRAILTCLGAFPRTCSRVYHAYCTSRD